MADGDKLDFSFEQIDPGLYSIKKRYAVAKAGHGSDISGPYWMLIETEILKGKIWWISDGRKKLPDTRRHFIFLPPFSWAMEHYERGTEVRVHGLISRTKLNIPTIPGPILFHSQQALPKSFDGVTQFLRRVEDYETIGACTNPSSLSARAKRLLDTGYPDAIEIKNIAAKLKTQPATLSRTFKADFGETPVFYRKGLRVTVGMHELMMGTPPVRAAELAGYSDLSRFYKQFKAYLKQTPSEYMEKSKNAKTTREA